MTGDSKILIKELIMVKAEKSGKGRVRKDSNVMRFKGQAEYCDT